MKRRTRINYTPEQKAIIWDRYKQGDSLHDIARMFDRFHSSIMPTILQTGGYRPPVRKRHRLALSLDEREEISSGGSNGIRDINFFTWSITSASRRISASIVLSPSICSGCLTFFSSALTPEMLTTSSPAVIADFPPSIMNRFNLKRRLGLMPYCRATSETVYPGCMASAIKRALSSGV